MRVPRMTTRRWMAMIAAIAVAFGGYFEVVRLKQLSDEYLRRSHRHVAAEGLHRRLGSPAGEIARERKKAEQAERAIVRETVEPDRAVERMLGLAAADPAPPERDVAFEE